MTFRYLNTGKIIILLATVLAVWSTPSYAAEEDALIPQDNDASYVIPRYIPRAAMPRSSGKIIFNDSPQDNDALYILKEAKPRPKKKAPQAVPQPVPAPIVAPAPVQVVPQRAPQIRQPYIEPQYTPEQLRQLQLYQEQQRRIEQDRNRYYNQYDGMESNRGKQNAPAEDYYPNYYY